VLERHVPPLPILGSPDSFEAENARTSSSHLNAAILPRPAAFLDRDGTIIEDVGYLSDVVDIKFLPGSVEAIRLLKTAGFLVIVATNQSGIARGLLSEAVVMATHERMQAVLQSAGASIDAFYYCPHLAEGSVPGYALRCDCRKPLPGMFYRARRDHGPFATPSYMFGDRSTDMQFAAAAGLEPRLIGVADRDATPHGSRFATLLDAVHHVLGEPQCPLIRL